MLVKCGTDLISIDRIAKAAEKLGRPFLQRIWTDAELADCLVAGKWQTGTAASLAARFAAKEAMAKALGTGIGRQGISWRDLYVSRDCQGAPRAELAGAARKIYEEMGGQSIALSLCHESGLAQAFCVILCASDSARGQENVT